MKQRCDVKIFSKESLNLAGKRIIKYKLFGIVFFKKEKFADKSKWRILGLKFAHKTKVAAISANDFSQEAYIKHLHKMYCSKDEFCPIDETGLDFESDVNLIAFYLPQFHTFDENDAWHGKGFTEWTNVTKALPHFIGHRQPHLPIDVGFYDLSTTKVMKRQIELAKLYGIYGFCFHYYWFSGKRLMEKPIFNWLEDKSLDFPFCLCWANENWSKLWDGGNKEVLLKQELGPDDDERFARDILPFFQDKRYIKIKGRPLFVIYNPSLFKKQRFLGFLDTLKTFCLQNGVGEPYVLVSNCAGFNENPKAWGAEAIVEFPPHSIWLEKMNKKFVFESKMTVFDFAKWALKKEYIYPTNYKTFKCVFPSWDNTARKAYSGACCFEGCTPKVYQTWLEDCIEYTRQKNGKDEQFVFINAFNEWAEGAHLEPDSYYGYAYLDATKKALIHCFKTKNRV